MKKIPIILCLVFLIGCQDVCDSTTASKRQPGRLSELFDTYDTQNITKVISEPLGARIEVDNDYIGDAPCEIKWEGSLNRTFSRSYTVRALPTYEGHFVQVKYFGWSDIVPKTIFFDMRLGPIPKQYELDIK